MRNIERVLITGIAGSGGSYLAEYICADHPAVAVHGFSRWHSTTGRKNLAAIAERVTVHEVDLLDFGAVARGLEAAMPDAIFHLASHANVKASFATPAAVLENNIMGTHNLLEALRLVGCDALVHICSSSEVYGQVSPDRVPIREDTPMRPASPYAVSKCVQDLLGYTYFAAYGMHIVRTRMFSYFNPRRADLFSTAFARQVAEIEAGRRSVLLHGNLNSIRTLVDVRDAMRAYWAALTYGKPGEAYNIGAGRNASMSVGQFLGRLIAKARTPVIAQLDENLLRPADVTLQIPDTGKFREATDWQPQYSFDESLDHLLEHVRREAGVSAHLDEGEYTARLAGA